MKSWFYLEIIPKLVTASTWRVSRIWASRIWVKVLFLFLFFKNIFYPALTKQELGKQVLEGPPQHRLTCWITRVLWNMLSSIVFLLWDLLSCFPFCTWFVILGHSNKLPQRTEQWSVNSVCLCGLWAKLLQLHLVDKSHPGGQGIKRGPGSRRMGLQTPRQGTWRRGISCEKFCRQPGWKLKMVVEKNQSIIIREREPQKNHQLSHYFKDL